MGKVQEIIQDRVRSTCGQIISRMSADKVMDSEVVGVNVKQVEEVVSKVKKEHMRNYAVAFLHHGRFCGHKPEAR